MASETVTLTTICDGDGHLTFAGTGAKSITLHLVASEVLDPVSDAEAETFVRVLVKLGKPGRTNAQLKALFQAGVTVTV